MTLLLALAACHGERVVVSDLHGDRWEVVDPWSGRIEYVHDVDGTNVDDCRVQDDRTRFCLTYQSRHRLDADGHDEVAYTYTPVGDDASTADELRGRIVGTRPGDPGEERWRLDRLDWSAVDPDRARCAWAAADPCRAEDDATEAQVRACTLYWPHDFRVLGESADALELVVADTRNDRVVWVTLARDGGTCGQVTEVLDHAHPDWDTYASINAIDAWEEGGERQLLLTSKDSLPDSDPAQTGGDVAAKGKILHWADDGTGWRQVWEFPPQSTDTASFVNAPHGIAHDDDHVYFAHALGRADVFEDGTGGSVGVLGRDGSYGYDAVPNGEELRYARSVDRLADGRLIVVDSGTKGDETPDAETALLLLDLPDSVEASGGTGRWSADHSEQTFVPVRVLRSRVPEDARVLYSVATIATPGPELGP